MALTKTDKKEIAGLMSEAITELVLPKFDEMDKRFDQVDKRFDKIEEDLEDVHLTVNRIETFQKSELGRVDNHEVRITKLEKAIIT